MTPAATPKVTMADALVAQTTERDLRDARVRLGEALPDDGWLGQYVRACVPLTDAPVEFHLAAGLAALAAAIGNRSWVEAWGQRTYPHLWMVLLAASSFWRKTTSINLAADLVRDALPDAVYPNDFSREAFLEELGKQPWGLLVQSEFGEFLASMKSDYNNGTQQTFTNIYDGKPYRRVTKTAGKVTVAAPAVTILAASTVEWLERELTASDIEGGFIPRFAWITAAAKSSDKGRGSLMDAPTRNELVKGLKRIGDRGPAPAEFEPAAEVAIDAWRRSFEERADSETHAASVKGFGARLATMTWKLAILHALSLEAWAMDGQVHVPLVAAERAIAQSEVLYGNVTGLIDEGIATTDDQRVFRRILRRASGKGVAWGDLLRSIGMPSAKLRPFVLTLVERGQIDRSFRDPGELGLEREKRREIEWLVALSSTRVLPSSLSVRDSQVGLGSDSGGNGANGHEVRPNGDIPERELREVDHTENPLSSGDSAGSAPVEHTAYAGARTEPRDPADDEWTAL